jgi:hypothetical protein
MKDSFPHKFVDLIPKVLEERLLYVSIEHAVAVHLCACGCARKVVTPLAPIHWKMIFDGRSVSLKPSIGNHAFPCKSHYWIEKDRVHWSHEMSIKEVQAVRERDERRRRQFYGEAEPLISVDTARETNVAHAIPVKSQSPSTPPLPWWRRLFG